MIMFKITFFSSKQVLTKRIHPFMIGFKNSFEFINFFFKILT